MARLLIADDDVDTTFLLRTLLAQKGHEVHCACDLEEALAIGRRTEIDLAICDWEFVSTEGGLELAQRLCKEAPLLRLMFISGHPPESLWPRSRSLRVANILSKPLDIPQFYREVERALSKEGDGCGAVEAS